MKRILFGITIFLLLGSLIFSQEMNEAAIEAKNGEFEMRIRLEERSSAGLQKQGDSLAVIIRELKADNSLNIFERQRLERLLRESQALDARAQAKRQELAKTKQDYQVFLGEAVAWFDDEIRKQLASIQNLKTPQQERQKRIDGIIALKERRKQYSQKLEPYELPAPVSSAIEIGEFDSYDKMIQKADLVKDQEEKARKQLAVLKEHAKEAENELKLRSKMNELISDTYLMEHQSETFLATSKADKGRMTDAEEGVYNSDISAESEILVTIFDDFLKFDVSEISSMDLEFYLKNLNAMIAMMALSADSLQLKAEKFYRAAEMKREGSKK
ncbi:MAG: hypothetical protein ACOY90_13320 [Candidatus Zhuqueibacterota bacterium]